MARTPVDEITTVVKDAAYVSVGLGVLAFQRMQVGRNELKKLLEGHTDEAKSLVDTVAARVGKRAKMFEERVGAPRDR